MNQNAKMMAMALTLLPPQQQSAICIGVLHQLATANGDNPIVTDHGYVPSEEPLENVVRFLTAMNKASPRQSEEPQPEPEATPQ